MATRAARPAASLHAPQCRRKLFPATAAPNLVRRAVADRVSGRASNSDSLRGLLSRFDSDGDGRLTLDEAQQAFAALQALHDSNVFPATSAAPLATTTSSPTTQPHLTTAATTTSTAAPGPTSWDLEVFHGFINAPKQGHSPLSALMKFMSRKVQNTGKTRAMASDLLWSFCGMFAAVAALGVMNIHVRSWPVVGEWHQQGLGLLLGSFGTLCVLIFGRPEAEAVRVWNLLAGHVIATATVLTLLHVLGPSVLSRALAMACMITAMLFTDSVHPPGGALVLMAVDSAAIQRMDWWFMLYPSLTITIALLLPLGVAVNWLKRNVKFDFPASWTASASSTPARPSSSSPPPSPPTELRPKMA